MKQKIENRSKIGREPALTGSPSSIDYKLSTNKGFTILFAVLIASILLAIGVAIFEITVRELRLSSIARESQKAIYAADSGTECALYFAIPGSAHGIYSTTTPSTFVCNGQSFPNIGGVGYGATSTFTVSYSALCATISIGTHLLNAQGQVRTIIESRGYSSCDVTDPNRIERAFRVTF
jgi:Tfp pilus assembly protein PilX